MRPNSQHLKGFTVIELMIGMLITSTVLTAVATVAFALSVATVASGDTATKQGQLRQTTLRLNDMIGMCKLICAAPGQDLVVWRADDNADRQINVNELVYIERGAANNLLRFCQFAAPDNPHVTLSDLALETTKAALLASYPATYTPLIPSCQSVTFAFYPSTPPVTCATCLRVSFTWTENRANHTYECVTALRSRAGNLLNAAGTALVASDDD